jgi:predicted CopG family antitoxin
MKTITLDEEAYALLKLWKRSGRESFSAVIKQVVPKPGTLGAFLSFVESNHGNDPTADETMERAINDRSATKEDSWTL